MREPIAAALLGAALLAPGLSAQQTVGGCQVLPRDNVWNTPVASLPVAANSAAIVAFILANGGDNLHPDFGAGTWEGAPIGMPFSIVPQGQAMVPIDFDFYDGWPDESDAGPYPIPPEAKIEGGAQSQGDRHVLTLRQGACELYELYYSWPHGSGPDGEPACQEPGGWCGLSGAVWELGSNALRPEGWTSADAAGLPLFPGLARWGEVSGGEVHHTLRFTVGVTKDWISPANPGYVWPGRHEAGSSTHAAAPPMGLRLRLKADWPIPASFHPEVRTILVGLKRYGMLLADNGSNWYISGIPSPNWTDELVGQFHQVPGSAFEVVDVTSLQLDPDSAATPHLFSDGFEATAWQSWWSAVVP